MIKPYKQTNYESCLAVCLMQLGNIKPSPRKELEIWKSGWKFNFALGQINYFSKRYKLRFGVEIENQSYCKKLSQVSSKGLTLESRKITLALVKKKLKTGPIALYVDNFLFQKTVHSPHFVLVESFNGNNYTVIDPWDGQSKIVSAEILNDAIGNLRKILLYSPVLIYIKSGKF